MRFGHLALRHFQKRACTFLLPDPDVQMRSKEQQLTIARSQCESPLQYIEYLASTIEGFEGIDMSHERHCRTRAESRAACGDDAESFLRAPSEPCRLKICACQFLLCRIQPGSE